MKGWYNNKDFQLKKILDFKGEERANAVKNEVIKTKQNQYKFDKWCFPNQTPQELLLYLWKYGKVMYLKINGELYFFPFDSSEKYLTKLNAKNATFTIKGNFNRNIFKTELLTDAVKGSFPFIFLNSLQTAPEKDQVQLFETLKAVYNSNHANRQNKNKSHIVFVPKGTKHDKAIFEHYTNPDASPHYFIETNNRNGSNTLGADNFKEMSSNTQDLYNSYSQEAKDIIQEIKIVNGLPANNGFNKGSAQETDGQVEGQKIETAFKLKDEYDEISRGLKRLRSNHPTKQIEVELKNEIFQYIYSVMGVANEVKEDIEEDLNENEGKGIIAWLKRRFKKDSTNEEEVVLEEPTQGEAQDEEEE